MRVEYTYEHSRYHFDNYGFTSVFLLVLIHQSLLSIVRSAYKCLFLKALCFLTTKTKSKPVSEAPKGPI